MGYPDIEEIQFNRGKPLQFAATVETAPQFELPDYKGLTVQREAKPVTDEDLNRALDALRQQQVSFKNAERPVQEGDIAVVNYKGEVEGKTVTDIAPTAQGLSQKQGFWIDVPSQSFIPGFAEQLVGAKAGDKKTVNVDFPADFVDTSIGRKKRGVYDVEIVEVKEKVLPPIDDVLAEILWR